MASETQPNEDPVAPQSDYEPPKLDRLAAERAQQTGAGLDAEGDETSADETSTDVWLSQEQELDNAMSGDLETQPQIDITAARSAD